MPERGGLLALIRERCAQVTDRASRVRILGDLEAYARTFSEEDLREPAYDEDHHHSGSPEERVAYILTLDAVNFGSGSFDHLLGLEEQASGYYLIAGRLAERFRDAGPPSAAELRRTTAEEVAAIFGQDLEDEVRAELMAAFAHAWRALGAFLEEEHGGSFTAVVEAAGGSAPRLVEILARIPTFRDVARYDRLEVPFYKRAQIAVSDLALALGHAGRGALVELDRLTMFADNQVPHVLRLDGILDYREDLAERIDRAEPIPAGSPEEVEIRAVALTAVERLVELMRGRGSDVSPRVVDMSLWHRGLAPAYRRRPAHRTRTTAY